jgi:hypothetical protein
LGIITTVKWTIPEITTTGNTTQTISRIKYAKSQPTNKEFWAIIHIKLKIIETQKKKNYFKHRNLKIVKEYKNIPGVEINCKDDMCTRELRVKNIEKMHKTTKTNQKMQIRGLRRGENAI